MNIEFFLNEQLTNLSKTSTIDINDLLKIIYICFHSNIESELILSKIILSRIDWNTKVSQQNNEELNSSYKLLLNDVIQKTSKGAIMP